MKTKFTILISAFILFLFSNCTTETPVTKTNPLPPVTIVPPVTTTPPATTSPPEITTKNINYLALGDSYTIGQSVCTSCRFPEQLKAKLVTKDQTCSLDIIATTGWTTSDLLYGIQQKNPSTNYDLVTLLIGVNNQYQGIEFGIYEKEFPELVAKSIIFAKGDKKRVIVVSIPDYAYTPYGQTYTFPQDTSREIDKYNAFAEKYCNDNGICFVNITDITRNGLKDTSLVANDGLHPSEVAYSLFIEKLLPKAILALQVK